MEVTDFKLIDGDLSFFQGDFDTTSEFTTDADVQCIQDMLDYNKGELKEFPFLGVGINNYLASSGNYLKLRQEVQLNLEADKYSTITLNGSQSILSVDFGTINLNINAVRNG